MGSKRASAVVGSGLLVVGAILVGHALHVSIVEGTYAVTAPAVVLPAGLGIVLVAVGHRLDAHPREFLSLPSEREGESSEAEFDAELSPLDEEALDERDRDRT